MDFYAVAFQKPMSELGQALIQLGQYPVAAVEQYNPGLRGVDV
jgi:hypothetical protein